MLYFARELFGTLLSVFESYAVAESCETRASEDTKKEVSKLPQCKKAGDDTTACTVPPLFSAAGMVTADRPASPWQRQPLRTYRLAKPPRSGR